jgi:hypothetical protein
MQRDAHTLRMDAATRFEREFAYLGDFALTVELTGRESTRIKSRCALLRPLKALNTSVRAISTRAMPRPVTSMSRAGRAPMLSTSPGEAAPRA